MIPRQGVFPLKGVVQNYTWGGLEFIPELLKEENVSGKPFAEYWLGAHPNFPSHDERGLSLDALIEADPSLLVGDQMKARFNTLPYLFKILDVRQMLSIQVHPDKATATMEFDKENQVGRPLTDPKRNYKDKNHKPELMVALGDFWLLHGFKNEERLASILEKTPELQFLKDLFASKGYKGLYEKVMWMPQEQINHHLEPLVQRILPIYQQQNWKKNQEDFWAARAATIFCREDYYDRGIFSIYFFNLVHLHYGQGVYQQEGMPHAYLEGRNVEVMANSDNVLRAGLTDKHIDVDELMRNVRFEATEPKILQATGNHTIYPAPVDEFELHHYHLNPEETLHLEVQAAEIILLMKGSVRLKFGKSEWKLERGDSMFISAGTSISLSALSAASVFRVTIPLLKN